MKKHIASLLTRSLLLTLALVGLVQAEDTPQLQQIKHTILSPSSEQIVLKLSGSYSPKTFTLKDQSPRVVFDFDDMTQGKGVHNLVTTEGSLIKAIRVGVHRDQSPKTRVVVDLNSFKGVNYTQQFDEKTSTLTIRFTGPEKKEGKETAKTKTETAKAKQTSEVTLPPNMPEEKSTQAKATDESAAVTPPPAEAVAPPAPVAVEPPPPAKETVAQASKEVPPPGTKEQKSGKKDKGKKAEEKALVPVKEQPIAAEAKPTQAVPVEKVVPPAPPAVPATPAVPPPVATTPQAQATAPVPPAVKESAPVAPKESPSTAAKELKGKKEEVKKAEEKTPPEVKQPAEQTLPVLATAANAEPELESIKFDPSSPKGEMIMFKLNGFHPPAVHGVEEGIPRVICDFNNTKLGSAAKKQIKTNGQHVKVIRTSVTKKPEKVRVVIDLEPNRSYDLQQVFFKDDNLFVIIVNTIGK